MDEDILTAVRTYAREVASEEIELLKALASIPAPTRDEGRRADFVMNYLLAAGSPKDSLERDAAGNVVLRLNVEDEPIGDAPDLTVYAAHMDVVFPDTDYLTLREEDGRLYAPGIGDDTANLVGLLMAARWLLQHPERLAQLDHGILIVADTCEEGLGNLDGTKELFRRYGSRIREFVTFDLFVPTLAHTAVGSHRWRLVIDGPGGHSYFDFGRPNPIELMAKLMERISSIPRTNKDVTYNFGRIEGGTTINCIPEHCEVLYEYRSTSDESLSDMREKLIGIVDAFRRELPVESDVTVSLELLGERPGMGLYDRAAQDALVGRCAKAMRAMAKAGPNLISASTDANVPLSLGIPACCVGTIRGEGEHTRGEWVETESLSDGLALILQIILEA